MTELPDGMTIGAIDPDLVMALLVNAGVTMDGLVKGALLTLDLRCIKAEDVGEAFAAGPPDNDTVMAAEGPFYARLLALPVHAAQALVDQLVTQIAVAQRYGGVDG